MKKRVRIRDPEKIHPGFGSQIQGVKSIRSRIRIRNTGAPVRLVTIVLLLLQCTEMEAYMAQYGYQAPPPPDPASFDVFSSSGALAPAAAADLAAINDPQAASADDKRTDGPAQATQTEQVAPAIEGK
jgi:hypothetical protein